MVHSFSTSNEIPRVPAGLLRGKIRHRRPMSVIFRILIGVVVCLAAAGGAALAALLRRRMRSRRRCPVSLFRIFLRDGSSAVSYGEYARLDDEVVFSMPLGTSARGPRLQLITLRLRSWTGRGPSSTRPRSDIGATRKHGARATLPR